MSAKIEVLAANRAFYAAFAASDLEAMDELWAREHEVMCIHPGWEALHGREPVLSSFRSILISPHSPNIRATDERAFIEGGLAFVTCVERIGAAELAATNVFARERGAWKLVHHHSSPVAPEKLSDRPPPKKSELN